MTYRCEHCGAALKVAEGDVNVTCEYCNTTFSIQALREVISDDEPVTVSLEKMLIRGEILLEDEEFSKAEELYDKILMIEPTCARAYIGQIQATYEIKYEKNLFKTYVDVTELAQFHRAIQFATPEYLAKLKGYDTTAEYKAAVNAANRANTPAEALRASALFENLGDYQDARQWVAACKGKAQAMSNKRHAFWGKENASLKQRDKEASDFTRKAYLVVAIIFVLLYIGIEAYVLFFASH